MFRTFKVATEHYGGEKSSYFITDAENDAEIKNRPKAIVFPVSQVFDDLTQKRRAKDYCDYLNKLAEAGRQAYEQNQLVNVLKS